MGMSVYAGPVLVITENRDGDPDWNDISEAIDEALSLMRWEEQRKDQEQFWIPNRRGIGHNISDYAGYFQMAIHQNGPEGKTDTEKEMQEFENMFDNEIQTINDMFGNDRIEIRWMILNDYS